MKELVADRLAKIHKRCAVCWEPNRFPFTTCPFCQLKLKKNLSSATAKDWKACGVQSGEQLHRWLYFQLIMNTNPLVEQLGNELIYEYCFDGNAISPPIVVS